MSSSPPSVTPASDLTGLIKACGEAVEELKASRTAIQRQKAEIVLQAELLKLEKEISIGLRDIRTLDEKEKILLRQAIAASQDANLALKEQNLALKKQKFTLWKGIKAVTLGVAAGIVLGAVLSR